MSENEILILSIVVGVLLIAAVAIFIVMFLRGKGVSKKYKSDSVDSIGKMLESFCKHNYGQLISNVGYTYKNKDYHYDYCAILPYGILNVNVVDYNGTIYGDISKARWGATIETKSKIGSENPLTASRTNNIAKTTHFDNPVTSFESANAAMRYYLGHDKIYSLKIESLAVFTTYKRNMSVPGKIPVCPAELLKKVLKMGYSLDNDVNVEKVSDSIKKFMN